MQVDEVTGKQVLLQRRWQEGDGPNVPFSHHVVSDAGAIPGTRIAGSSHMLGSLNECRQWQLAQGVRATTRIEVF